MPGRRGGVARSGSGKPRGPIFRRALETRQRREETREKDELRSRQRRRISIGAIMLLLALFGALGSYGLYVSAAVDYPSRVWDSGGVLFVAPKGIGVEFELHDPVIDSAPQELIIRWDAPSLGQIVFQAVFFEEARSENYVFFSEWSTAKSEVDIRTNRDQPGQKDVVTVTVVPEHTGRDDLTIDLWMDAPLVARSDSRLVVSGPFVAPVLVCDDPGRAGASVSFYARYFTNESGCEAATGASGVGVSLSVSVLKYDALRTDYASAELSQIDLEKVVWTMPQDMAFDKPGTQIRASFTDVPAEAAGQRLLFWAGIVGGLAGGVLVLGIELIFLEKRLKIIGGR